MNYIKKININTNLDKAMRVVLDVELYSEFLDFIHLITVTERKNNVIFANVTSGFRGILHTYRCRIEYLNHEIKINTLGDDKLQIQAQWFFDELASDLTKVDFQMQIKSTNYLIKLAIKYAMNLIADRTLKAFTKRMES